MGVLNATPDSFYAGSRTAHRVAALQRATDMMAEGADVLDIGGESTRPGAEPVSAATELERVLPILDAIHDQWPSTPLSIDTQKAEVALRALEHGASLVNDVSALRADPGMVDVISSFQCPVVLMHMQGNPQTMQSKPHYTNVVDEIRQFFEERIAFLSLHHISQDRIILDPGIGFGKTVEHNLLLIKNLSQLTALGYPVLIGVSRKGFIGKLLGTNDEPLIAEERLEGSLAAALWAVEQGAKGLRVHDVGATRRAVQLWERIHAA